MTEPIVIRGGHVIDGSGSPGRDTDIAIEDGRILEIGDDIATSGAEIIDATNRVVAPGFIDIKTHSDWTLPLMPEAESKIRQGVTTEVIGHCGYSCAPALPEKVDALADYLSPSAPWLTFRATTFADYLARYPALSVNTVHLVGHNTLRLMAMGMEDRPPTKDEMAHMRALLHEALDAGALGMSSGLFTAPGFIDIKTHSDWTLPLMPEAESKIR
ncbi:MAG: amidohydrolase family protein, partial [Pseudomonadota bacterium]|nr:amidohydrolase family protein [Pseudomonadota bacterium]